MLAGKTVFITGASSGIGEAIARLFAQNGAKLILCARQENKLEQLKEILVAKYQIEVYTFGLDVRNSRQVFENISNFPTAWQAVDILVNNAGLAAGLDKFQNANLDDWEQMIDTNLKGLLYVTKAVLPGMLERNNGHIINIGSIAGHECYPGGSVYSSTKHAVAALTKSLKLDLLGTPIRVSTVDPGMVNTNFSKVRFKGDEQKANAVYEGLTPLSAEDVADALLYCVTRPAHVNISEIILFPTDQSSINHVYRKTGLCKINRKKYVKW